MQDSDDVYRPQRKQMPSENTPQSNLNKLEEIAEIRQMASNIGEENSVDPQGYAEAPQIKGNVPPQFNEMLKNKSANKNKIVNRSSHLPVDETLQGLLDQLRENSSIYEEITLPSLGKFYDGTNGPSDGILHIRPMTGEEEQILATPRLVQRGQALDMIFNRCIQERYNTQNFLSQDRIFILIYLRGISYSPEYEVEVRCPFTDRTFSTNIDLELPVDVCPDDYGPSNLVDTLPKTKFRISYRLPTGVDDSNVQEYSEKVKKEFNTQVDDTLIYKSALLTNEIEGVSDKTALKILLKNLPAQDLNYIRNLTTEVPFGVNTKIPLVSPFTLQEFEAELPIGVSFFSPRPKKKA